MEQSDTPQFPPTPDRPHDENPGIRLIFTGMVIFTYKRIGFRNEGRVVFHRASPNHNLRIQVLEDCSLIYALGGGSNPIRIREMEFGIIGRESDAAFFQNGGFNRAALQGDDKDFRWLLDLEGPDFHNGKFTRTENKFSTKLKVKHGTFYTYKHTGHYFKCDRGVFKDREVGYVPKVMAVDIALQGDDCASLLIDGKDVLTNPLCNNGHRYEIYFSNECEHDCDVHGDFEMTFDAVNINPDEKFNLTPIGGHDNGQADGLCLAVPFEEGKTLTDEAPCMGSGFGGGGGFP